MGFAVSGVNFKEVASEHWLSPAYCPGMFLSHPGGNREKINLRNADLSREVGTHEFCKLGREFGGARCKFCGNIRLLVPSRA